MAPLTTGAPLVTAHAIHAKANSHGAKKKAHRHAAPKKSRSPKLHPRRTTHVAKKAVRRTSAYRVRPGDNLTAIAARHGVSLSALIKANHFGNPNIVFSGSTIRIPHHSATHTARKTTPRKAVSRHHGRRSTATPKHRTTAKKTTAEKRRASRLAAKVAATRAALAKRHVPTRTQTKRIIEKTARRYGVNPRLALGIGWQESGWNQRAVSPANAIGAMQVMPQSGEWASAMVGRKLNLMDAHDNVTAGVAILRYLTSNAKDLNQAIGGYYQGLGAMREHGPYPDTRRYVRNVRALMHRL